MLEDHWGNKRLGTYSNKAVKNLRDVRIVILIGSLGISGGTNLILQYAKKLKEAGADVTLSHLLGKASDLSWHPFGPEFRVLPLTRTYGEYFDLAIATWWPTVYELPKLRASRFMYFVQSLESRFALNSQDRFSEIKAAGSYLHQIPMVTVASWLQNLLVSETGTPTWFIRNGVDRDLFPIATESKSLNPDRKVVLVEGVLGVGMKAVDETIEMVRSVNGVELWHVTPEARGGSALADRVFEGVPLGGMSEIYRQATVFVKMSRVEGMFGPPLEAFHSGVPGVFSKVTGHDEYIVDQENSLLVEVDDFPNAKSKLEFLLENSEVYKSLSHGALDSARRWPSLQDSADEFTAACFSVLNMNEEPNTIASSIRDFESRLHRLSRDGRRADNLVPPSLLARGR